METLVSVVSLTLILVFLWILFSRPDSKNISRIHLSDQVKEIAADPSRRSEAVESCMGETGASRAVALLAVELFVAGQLSDTVKEIATVPGRKIEAIKLLREQTGVSLLAAKMAVEEFMSGRDSAG